MRRPITVLATGLLLLAGFTAAAVASGGSPLDLIASPATTAHDAGARHSARPKRAVASASSQPRPAEESGGDTDEDRAEVAEPRTTRQSERKVVICHHTGSWKHPFHPINVDQRSVAAHTRHGDTLGNCPSVPASEPRASRHGKPPWAQGPKEHARGRSSEHAARPGNAGQEEGHGQGTGSAHKNDGKED